MHYNKGKRDAKLNGIQVGISSLLLIFTVVCIVIFCVLSFSSARADYALAKKAVESAEAYYGADARGEQFKKEVNDELVRLAAGGDAAIAAGLATKFGDDYDAASGTVTFEIETSYEQILTIKLKPNSAKDIVEGKQNFSVKEWQIQNKEDLEIDNSMPVWTGE